MRTRNVGQPAAKAAIQRPIVPPKIKSRAPSQRPTVDVLSGDKRRVAVPVEGLEKIPRPEMLRQRRIEGLLKKLQNDSEFGTHLLEGMTGGHVPPETVVDQIGDLMNKDKRSKLVGIVKRYLEMIDTPHKDPLLDQVRERIGSKAAEALALTHETPTEAAAYLMGAVAGFGELGSRPKLAQLANQLEDILSKYLSAQPQKAPKSHKRPSPTMRGTEKQGELSGRLLRADYRMSGPRFVGAYRDAEIARARAMGIEVDPHANEFLDKTGNSAGFDYATGTVRLRDDATVLEWFHEMTHAEQWKEMGTEAYLQQTRLERELHVFRAIQANSHKFNTYEFEAARNYIMRLAKEVGAPTPPELLS